jgi:hypothetical protein
MVLDGSVPGNSYCETTVLISLVLKEEKQMGVQMARDGSTGACDSPGRITRSLLGYGVLAGPFYVSVVLVQALIRPGFDLTRHDASLLSNGSLGWIQIANFVLTGAMVVACAVGLRRALAAGAAANAGALLLALFGLGMIGAGIFIADPMNGFPPGAPAGRPVAISNHGVLHLVSAGIGFLAFAASCFVIAQRFARERRTAWTWFSRATGLLFLAGFGGLASGSSSAAVVVAFWVVLILAWAWLALISIHFYRRAGVGG